MCGGQTGRQPSTLCGKNNTRPWIPYCKWSSEFSYCDTGWWHHILEKFRHIHLIGQHKCDTFFYIQWRLVYKVCWELRNRSHFGMAMHASAEGSLQVLKQGITQESYLHWQRGPGGASRLGPDETHVHLLLQAHSVMSQKLTLLKNYGPAYVQLCAVVAQEEASQF